MWVCEGHSMLSLTALLCAPTSSASRNPLDELALSPTCQPSLPTPDSTITVPDGHPTTQVQPTQPHTSVVPDLKSLPPAKLLPGSHCGATEPAHFSDPARAPTSPWPHLAGLLTNRYGYSGNYWQGCNAEVQHKCPESKLLSI